MKDAYDDLLAKWFGIVQPTRHRDTVVKPEMLWRYEGGFRMGAYALPTRVPASSVRRIAEVYRGAHP